MRQIKFRGQRIDTKEWVYGDVIHYDSGEIKILEQNYRIWDILEGAYEVIPESVGQFTGLQDKNGNEVYEGDYDNDYQVVSWCERGSGWAMSIYDCPTKEHICCHCYSCEGNYEISEIIDDIEIIGNIHDNPELLK